MTCKRMDVRLLWEHLQWEISGNPWLLRLEDCLPELPDRNMVVL